jgi:hypothetical protein
MKTILIQNNKPNMAAKVQLQTSRFLFSEDITELLSEFAKIHHYDERKEYKAAWQEWIAEPDVKDALEAETERIQALGFKGNVIDKMFKSVRYYYRKKNSNQSNESDTKGSRTYNMLPESTFNKIDEHIKSQIKANLCINDEQIIESKIKPSTCFENFCNINKQLFLDMLDGEQPNNQNLNQIVERLKKAYKNRYYNIKVSIENKKSS